MNLFKHFCSISTKRTIDILYFLPSSIIADVVARGIKPLISQQFSYDRLYQLARVYYKAMLLYSI